MFQKESLIKNFSFIICDVLMIICAMVIATCIRFGSAPMSSGLLASDNKYVYIYVLLISIASAIFVYVGFSISHHIFDRGIFAEIINVLKILFGQTIAVLFYLFMSKQSADYSRIQMAIFLSLDGILIFAAHQFLKIIISKNYKKLNGTRQIMLVSSKDKVEKILEKFNETNNWYFNLAYIALVDADMTGQKIGGIPVIANKDTMFDVAKTITLDGVFINVAYGVRTDFDIQKTLHNFQNMGVTVHVNIDALELDMTDKMIENLGFFKVVSYSNRFFDPAQLVLKKCMDKVGGLIGCIITILIGIVLVPIICLESEGSPVYSQIRVGKNGRRFKIYKFRSMYKDADARKAELMDQNEMDGAMFKMEDDPRVTKVGKFIRKHSIDELPQFFNVLMGDMSLVGTRPPTVDEVEQYENEQKRRLSVTPGITGLWQVSGRSSISSFDEIVELDLKYIDQWSVGLDIKLLFKTIVVCFTGRGAS